MMAQSASHPTVVPARLSFPSTYWYLIQQAANPADVEQARAALGRLLERYQAPLLAYLCNKFNCGEDQAKDWFQAFVAERIL